MLTSDTLQVDNLDARIDREEQRSYPPKPSPEVRAEYERILTGQQATGR
jgi:hypothetical protein